MSIQPIDHQISALNTVHEAKNQQENQNKAQTINSMMQDQVKSEVEKNQSRVNQSDNASGALVDPDQQQKREQQSKRQSKKNSQDDNLPKAKEDSKGRCLDIRI